jgi:large subunit ribosomal protein L25
MELKVFERTQKPSALRADGMLPAVVYDKGSNKNIYVERKAFDKVFRSVSTHGVITLEFADGAKVDTLVKDVSMDKRRRQVQHADFFIVSDAPVEVSIPVHTTGVAKGIKEQGGVLDIVMHTVTVKATPKKLPQELLVDVTEIGLGEPFHTGDFVLPEGVTLVGNPKDTVLVIHAPRSEEAAVAVTGVIAPAAEPEVITKGKKEEE